MALIFNATNEVQSVKALGNWFTFKPKQIKPMQDNIAQFIAEIRSDRGLVILPESMEDMEFRESPEGKAILAEKEEQGISNFVETLRKTIYNNQVSVRQDLDKANLKIDPAVFASEKGDNGSSVLENMRILARYQRASDDREQKQVDEVKELMKKTGPVSK